MARSGYWLHKWTDETSSCDPHGRWSGGLDCYERDYSMWIPDRIKPDDTVAVNDYIDRQFELSAEVADGLEVIDAADAQATIAALQAEVKELEEITKVICGHCCEPMEIPSKAVLQSALTRRTAELEAANELVAALSSKVAEYEVELNGDPQNFYGRGRTVGLRTLIAALPKVEGEIYVQRAEGLWYVWHMTPNGSQVMCGRFRRQEEAQSYVDLLQHRQGMDH